MFPLHYATTDFSAIVNYFLPILQAHKFDLYFCGHEHLLAYAAVPYPTQSTEKVTSLQDRRLL
jgi:hemolysin-activating ACP:hemolysin acyltransferase